MPINLLADETQQPVNLLAGDEPEMMQAALKTEAARQQFMEMTQHGILDRPREKLMSDAWGLVKNVAGDTTRGVPATLNQAVSKPGTASKNLLAGLLGGVINLGNVALNVPQYVAGLESEKASNFLKKYTPEIPTEGIVNTTFGEPSQSDTDVRKLGALLPILGPLSKAGGKAVISGGSKVLGKTDPALAANEALLGTQVEGKATELDQKTAAAEAAKEANEQAIAQSQQEVRKSNPNTMKFDVNTKQQVIDELTQKNTALKDQLTQIKPEEGLVSAAESKLNTAKEAKLKALQDVEANDAAYSAAIDQSKLQTGKSTPDLMEFAAKKRQENISNLMNEATDLQKQLGDTKVEEGAIPQAEENLNTAQAHHQNTQNMANNIDSNIDQFLNKDAQHDVRFSQGLTHRVNAIEDYASNNYKTLMQNISDAKFQMPKSAMEKLDYDRMSPTQLIQSFGNDAFEALKKGKIDEFIKKQKTNDLNQAQGNNPYLQNLMEVAPTITDTNAADFLAKYKDFRDRTFKLSRRWSDPRVEEVEKQKMGDALTEARKMQAKMKEVLDEGLGEYKPAFEEANKLYSEQVYPLRENPIVEKSENGINSSNIIHDLRTNQEGMPLVRELVKQDPELLRNAIGQRYFSKPDEIHNPNETMREYLGEMPQLQRLLTERENANAALEQSLSNLESAKQQHADLIKRQAKSQTLETNLGELHDNIEKGKQELSKLKENLNKLREVKNNKKMSLEQKIKTEQQFSNAEKEYKDIKKRQDDAEKIEKDINDSVEEINKHTSEISKMKSNITRLEETTKNKKISLKDQFKTQKELKELRQKLKETSTKLDEKTTGLRKLWRVAKTIYRLKKII
jgi:predicted  nucleic acid-binding Zn-ribbon protein